MTTNPRKTRPMSDFDSLDRTHDVSTTISAEGPLTCSRCRGEFPCDREFSGYVVVRAFARSYAAYQWMVSIPEGSYANRSFCLDCFKAVLSALDGKPVEEPRRRLYPDEIAKLVPEENE